MPDQGAASLSHPAPHAHKVGLTALMFGFWGGPIAATAQLLLNYGLSSQVCYPGPIPRTAIPVDWRWLTPALLGFDVLAFVVAVAAAAISYRSFAATREESEGDSHHLLEVGEGRSRFLALCGLITASGFLLIVAFEALSLILVPPCGR